MRTHYALVGRGLAGWHAQGVNVSATGCYDAEPPADWLCEGTAVYDASEADVEAFTRWTLSGPMAEPALAAGMVDPLHAAQRKHALAMCGPGGLSGGYEVLVAQEAAQAEQGRPFPYGSLDRVAIDVYLALLREHVPGVRFGTVVGGAIQWEACTQP